MEATQVWALVDRAKAGSESACARLYQLHVDEVFRYVLGRTGNRHLAEDVTSETFVRALRRIGTVNHRRSTFGAWLTTIARNLVHDEVRSARRRHEVPLPEGYDAAADAPDPASVVSARELAGDLRRHLAELPGDQRRCLELRFYDDLSVAEVAERMARGRRAVSAVQLRALRRMGELISRADRKTPVT